jgi:nucleotide-binding universal stress UspA family protein/DNA-binding NarL/FixJ family response regulator
MANESVDLRILIVDDESLIRWSMAETLTDAGHTVIEAGDAKDTLHRLSTGPIPDLIFLDYRLPDWGDLTLLETVRRLVPACPVIMMTAYGTPMMRDDALALGAYRVIDKPMNLPDLPLLVQETYAAGATMTAMPASTASEPSPRAVPTPASLQRILCPVNVFQTSRNPFEHALTLARWFHSSVTVLYVSPIDFVPPVPGMPTDADTLEHQQGMRPVTAFVDSFEHVGIDVQTLVEVGDPVERILECAETRASDLLVVGLPPHDGRVGSVAKKLARRASCPVLTIPLRFQPVVGPPFRHILYATDFSVSSLHALRHARSLARDTGADLCVLYVARQLQSGDPPRHRAWSLADLDHVLEPEVAERLHQLAAAHALDDVDFRVGVGTPWREIIRVANECDSDLIVMGVQGKIDWLPFGSTTSHVIASWQRAVLTIRS